MFAKLTCLADLQPYYAADPMIREKIDETTGFTIVCYMLQDVKRES